MRFARLIIAGYGSTELAQTNCWMQGGKMQNSCLKEFDILKMTPKTRVFDGADVYCISGPASFSGLLDSALGTNSLAIAFCLFGRVTIGKADGSELKAGADDILVLSCTKNRLLLSQTLTICRR